MVVRGVAVVLRGHARLTADLDLAVDLAAPAAGETIAALVAIGFRPRLPVDASEFADAYARARWSEQKGFVENPIEFEEPWANADALDLGTTFANVASIGDLIRRKQIAGRPEDLADIEALEAIAAREDEG